MLIAHWGHGASHGGRGKNGIITDMVKITMYQVSVGTLIITVDTVLTTGIWQTCASKKRNLNLKRNKTILMT